jgi:hypothetical protein
VRAKGPRVVKLAFLSGHVSVSKEYHLLRPHRVLAKGDLLRRFEREHWRRAI